jgi:hypothetical protein
MAQSTAPFCLARLDSAKSLVGLVLQFSSFQGCQVPASWLVVCHSYHWHVYVNVYVQIVPVCLARGSRQSVEPVAGRCVDASTCLQDDERDEVVLVGAPTGSTTCTQHSRSVVGLFQNRSVPKQGNAWASSA